MSADMAINVCKCVNFLHTAGIIIGQSYGEIINREQLVIYIWEMNMAIVINIMRLDKITRK